MEAYCENPYVSLVMVRNNKKAPDSMILGFNQVE